MIDDMTLYDDGSHGDTQASDGVYFNAYTNTAARGEYIFKVSASGTVSNTDFIREDVVGAVLSWDIYLPLVLKSR
jgi:hypothetical protein